LASHLVLPGTISSKYGMEVWPFSSASYRLDATLIDFFSSGGIIPTVAPTRIRGAIPLQKTSVRPPAGSHARMRAPVFRPPHHTA